MAKKFLIPVLALAFCATAYGQKSYSSSASYSPYSGGSGSVHSASAGSLSSSRSMSSYSNSSSSSSHYSGSGSYSGSTGGSGRFGTSSASGDRSFSTYRQNAYTASYGNTWKGQSASMGVYALDASVSGVHSMMDDKYTLAPIPKTVPTSSDHVQRGYADYSGGIGGAGGSGGGMITNLFYTPGFSGDKCQPKDDSHDYQVQFNNFVRQFSLYGRPYYMWGRNRLLLNSVFFGVRQHVACEDYLNMALANAKTPGEVVEVMKAYWRCMNTSSVLSRSGPLPFRDASKR